jgi:SAM-dependent methyltransferase
MPLAYYSVTADQDFWTEHWGGHAVSEMLASARISPLTALITDALPTAGPVLEAGCGLGQYVLLLREWGWPVVGVDWSVQALDACRQFAPAPLAAMDLRSLGLRTGAVSAYLSLGIVEHDPEGPDAILAEARRVLSPRGILVLSVPYVNGARKIASSYILWRNRAIERHGGRFYQYAFSRAELVEALDRHGFVARSLHPYDPVRLLRRALPGRARRRTMSARPAASGSKADRGWFTAAARRLLYTLPALRMLGHMLLAVAVKR